ncbi:MAG: hypothetical protein PF444_04235 [Bacteroidales bacterium]|jgi:hypothetical protein|nr:hypothetical protein [Bacteroidales bacterium]
MKTTLTLLLMLFTILSYAEKKKNGLPELMSSANHALLADEKQLNIIGNSVGKQDTYEINDYEIRYVLNSAVCNKKAKHISNFNVESFTLKQPHSYEQQAQLYITGKKKINKLSNYHL